jgi:hypothetical protein
MGRLREWYLDWLDRSDVRPSARKIDDPITILQRTFGVVAGIVAVLSSPAINVLAPNLNTNATMVLRLVVALVILAAVHHVVTAKDVVEAVSGSGSETRTYRFSTTERLIARGVVVASLLLLALNLVPGKAAPQACNLAARTTWQATGGSARPLILTVTAGDGIARYAVDQASPVAIQVPPEHAGSFSIALEWSDNSRSDFGTFSSCATVVNRSSGDDRAKIDLAPR